MADPKRDTAKDAPSATQDDRIIEEAKTRFTRCESFESDFRALFVEDLKFVHGDSDNNWQWPDDIIRLRGMDEGRPCITINKTMAHANLVVNDAKENKVRISIHPTGEEASFEAAKTFSGIIRQIEYASRATDAYDKAAEFQTYCGIGYIKVTTAYADSDSFDQDIFIKRCANPLSIYMDSDAQEADKSDAIFAFEFESMSHERFNAKHPGHEEAVGQTPLGSASGGDDWHTDDSVRVARYWRRTQKADTLIHLVDEKTGESSFVRRSEITPEIWKTLEPTKPRTRPILSDKVEWFVIAGNAIVDRGEWAGKYIPIVPVIWTETVIEGKLERKGMVRPMKGAQQTYNYASSAGVEYVALQTKSPYIGPAEAFEGHEQAWREANSKNRSFLPTNHIDSEGKPIPQPTRANPPTSAAGYTELVKNAEMDMMRVSGQYQAQMGENENAKSGVAIQQRQRQGDRATYQGIDGLAIGVRQVGRILVDLIPKVYDTERVVAILAEDGERTQVKIDPMQKEALQKESDEVNNNAAAIFNPRVGKYSVQADVGADYATKRQQAFDALSQIIAGNSELLQIAGDLLFKSADFPGADELADRLRKLVPPAALGQGPSPDQQQAAMQMAQLQKLVEELTRQVADKDMKLKDRDRTQNREEFDADTRRIVALGNSGPAIAPETVAPLVEQVITDSALHPLTPDDGGGNMLGLQPPSGNPLMPMQ